MGFQLIQLESERTSIALNASVAQNVTRLYSPQLASLPGLFTSIKLVNTSWMDRVVTLRAIGEDGTEVAAPAVLPIGGYGSLEVDAGELFNFPPDVHPVGSLVVECSGSGVIGDVVFGDSVGHSYAAAMPLQTQPFTSAVFSHVANGFGLFTGMALFNPGSADAEVTVEVYSDDGRLTGRTEPPLLLPAGNRTSKLLAELLPESPEVAQQVKGYVLVHSSEPLFAQQLFGLLSEGAITMMSAVPPKAID